MSNGIRVIKENSNLAEWSRQVEECRSSGLSVRTWCEQNGIAASTFHYRQQKVWDALQKRNRFVEVPLQVNEYRSLKYIFTKAPNLNPGDSPDCLLPWNAPDACRTKATPLAK